MADVIATVWNLVIFVGFVVSLQIPKAESLGRIFEREASLESYERAVAWAHFVRWIPVVTVVAVACVIFAYGESQQWMWNSLFSTGFGLLLAPLLVQVTFAIIVLRLVQSVPSFKLLEPVWRGGGGKYPSSPKGVRPKATVRFQNGTDKALCINWLDFNGSLSRSDLEICVTPGSDAVISSYSSHAWLIQTEEGEDVAAYRLDHMCRILIEPNMIGSNSSRNA